MRVNELESKLHQTGGFSLVESLVAISVLLIVIVGPLGIAHKSTSYARFAGDRAVATFLAQDAMEYIIAKKNYNLASGQDWMTDLDSGNECKHTNKGCTIDTRGDLGGAIADQCPVAGCDPLLFDGEFYQYATGDVTKMVRTIYIEEPAGNANERVITVHVEFDTQVASDSYEVTLSVFKNNL